MDLTGVSPPPPPSHPQNSCADSAKHVRGSSPKCRFSARRSIFRGRMFMHDSLGAVVLLSFFALTARLHCLVSSACRFTTDYWPDIIGLWWIVCLSLYQTCSWGRWIAFIIVSWFLFLLAAFVCTTVFCMPPQTLRPLFSCTLLWLAHFHIYSERLLGLPP